MSKLRNFPLKATIVNADELHINDSVTNEDRKVEFQTVRDDILDDGVFTETSFMNNLTLANNFINGFEPTDNPVKESLQWTGAITYVLPRGIYLLGDNLADKVEVYISGAWRFSNTRNTGAIFSDGVNVRVNTPSTGINILSYIKF